MSFLAPVTSFLSSNAGTIISAAGTGIQTMGAIQQGQAAEAMGEYNAQIARQHAKAAEEAAAFDEEKKRKEIRKFLSTQRAQYGTAGVQTGSGSPLAILSETAREGELDALAIRYGGQVESQRAKSKGRLYKYRGEQAKRGSYYKAGASLLGGVGRAVETT